jgi:hypothetical protein
MWAPDDPRQKERPTAPPEVMLLRVAERFGVGVDGAMHHLGYPPPTPRTLRQWTLWTMDVAVAEGLYQKWQAKPDSPGFTPDEGRWFQREILDRAFACPGCGVAPGTLHRDGCPEDVG